MAPTEISTTSPIPSNVPNGGLPPETAPTAAMAAVSTVGVGNTSVAAITGVGVGVEVGVVVGVTGAGDVVGA